MMQLQGLQVLEILQHVARFVDSTRVLLGTFRLTFGYKTRPYVEYGYLRP
jgi:hypothetical protein